MKKLFFVIGIFLSLSVLAQDDQWVNQTSYIPTENCIDSVTCYTIVKMDVNLSALTDSSIFTINIGSTYGGTDFFTKTFIYSNQLNVNAEVESITNNVALFNLGSYIIEEEFFVTIRIE